MSFKRSFIFLSLFLFGQASALEIGEKAPQIIGRDIDKSLFALSRLESKPKVLNFFWVECKPCIKEMPHLAELEEKYQGVQFVSVHAEMNIETETNYDIEDIINFVGKLDDHPEKIVLGSDRIKSQYGFEAFPVTFLVSADNHVEKVIHGYNEKTIPILDKWLQKQ